MSYNVGASYRAALVVTDDDDQPVNATSVTLTITRMDGTSDPETPVVSNPPETTGLYVYDYQFTQAGLFRFDWETDDPQVSETNFENVRSFISCVGIDETREYLGVQDTRRDRALRRAMAAATWLAERIVGTIVVRTFTDDWITGSVRSVIRLPHGPVPSADAVASVRSVYPGGPSWATADLIVFPEGGTIRTASQIDFDYGPWYSTYLGGRVEIGENITNGVLEIIWDLWGNQRWVTGDTEIPDIGDVAAFESQLAGYRVPGRALELLEGDRMPSFG